MKSLQRLQDLADLLRAYDYRLDEMPPAVRARAMAMARDCEVSLGPPPSWTESGRRG